MKLVGSRYVDETQPDDVRSTRPEVVVEGMERPPATVNRWLAVALALSLLALGAAGAWIYLDHRQTRDEKAVAAVVAAHLTAWDDGDGTAVLATMTKDPTWVAVSATTSEIGNGLFRGAQLADSPGECTRWTSACRRRGHS